jgi:hypothetical protein
VAILAIATIAGVMGFASPGAAAPPSSTSTLIYFHDGANVWQMNEDGSSKQQLAALPGSPSHQLHGGKRYFLRNHSYYPELNAAGQGQRDLRLESDDGTVVVRLTGIPYWDPWGWWQFIRGTETATSVKIGGFARAFEADGTPTPGGGGIYLATLDFDASGVPTGLSAPPAFAASVGTRGNWSLTTEVPDAFSSPAFNNAGTEAIVDSWIAKNDLRKVNLSTGAITTIYTAPSNVYVYQPSLTPDDATLLFGKDDQNSVYSYIVKMPAGGGANTNIFKSGRGDDAGGPMSSPDGSKVVFGDYQNFYRLDVKTVAISGGKSVKNLTSDLSSSTSYAVAWR